MTNQNEVKLKADVKSVLYNKHLRSRRIIISKISRKPVRSRAQSCRSLSVRSLRLQKVIYTRTPESASRFDSYRFRLEGAGAAPRWLARAAAAPGQAVHFADLTPGRLYNVTMWTVSRNVTSHPVQRQARLCNYR